jgi:hypothetical protein
MDHRERVLALLSHRQPENIAALVEVLQSQ